MAESSLKASLKLIAKVAIPILIAAGVVWWQFGSDFKNFDLSNLRWTSRLTEGLLIALVLLFFREAGMAWRFHELSDKKLSGKDSVRVSLICDFTSVITPTSAGGSLLSMIFLHRRGLNIGQATAITILTLFLDMMFFVVTTPIVFLLISPSEILNFSGGKTDTNLAWVLTGIYLLIIIFSIILAVGIFYKPKAVGAFFLKLTSYKLLSRFRGKATELADGLNRTSCEIKQYSWRWWIAPSLATITTWVARMLLVNAIFFAFIPEANQPVIFARQIIVTILLMFVPTPGGSGVGEMLFKTYYADMINGPVIAIMAIIWRLFTSYIFLLAGTIVLPSFLKLYSSIPDKTELS